ncbi:MAG TPA: RsmE family RNA methyltransferase [Atribacteraceae bacterium]|nr:RsmE family RNA methyltransferase [Atribacteraceae bacterium]
MARYYFAPSLKKDRRILLRPEESRHLRSDRVKPGAEVVLSDGKGSVVTAVLQGWREERALLDIVENRPVPQTPSLLCCCLALIKSQNRLDWAVEKMTELGAGEIVFFPAAHSIRQSLTVNHLARMEKIIREAGKQTGKTVLPRLLWLERWEDFIRYLIQEGGIVYPAFPDEDMTLLRRLGDCARDRAVLVIGPEGDFTSGEKATLAGLPRSRPVRLTKDILRSETALFYGASLLSAFLEDDLESCPENPWL